MFSIIEIGSNNTKIHIYKEEKLIYEKTITIEFKKNYQIKKQINEEDLNKLYEVIKNALTYTNNVNIYGCSIFRNISNEELDEINKKIYEQINDLVSSRIKEWAAKRTEKALDGAFASKTVNPSKVLDRDLEYNILRQDLLTNICSNEEQLANHLVYLFYVDKQSYNKNILWALVGRQIYENIRKKTSVYYYPQKNPNGSLEFLYEKYSIERVLVNHEEEIEEEEKGIKEESFYD